MIKVIDIEGYGLKYSCLVIGNRFIINKMFYDEFHFGLYGLGLNKLEREIFQQRFMEFRGILNFYIGRIIISYEKNGYKNAFKRMDIVKEKVYL